MIDVKKLGELEADLGPFLWSLPVGDEELPWHFSPSGQGSPALDMNPQGPRKKKPKKLGGFVALILRYGGEKFARLLDELEHDAPSTFPKDRILSLMRCAAFPDDLEIPEFQDTYIICSRIWLRWTSRYMTCVEATWRKISIRQEPELIALGFRDSLKISDDELLAILQRHFPKYKKKGWKTKNFQDRRERIIKELR
ncbi:hypothetical protein [Coraliomargarita parva]|uniref:hypothetical protein n=1 Tax=Coraliomargarita parva TaxID=3014050 RepID=UPI0022B57EEF|nr:hypothetical protein [Coraliomargarita parva]